jgi:hypothetical protein
MGGDNKQAARDYAVFAGKACMRAVDRILDANRRTDLPINGQSAELKAALSELADAQRNLTRALVFCELADNEDGERDG